MIQCSFQQVPDVNRKGELRLWKSGITSWQKLLDAPQKHPNFTKKLWNRLRTNVIQCQKALNNRDFEYFAQKFPEEIFWRLIPNLEGKILYFDIEATGLDLTKHSITTIATFDGKNIKYFVKGENLNEFIPYLENFDAITTFDGEKMDLPFIQKTFDFNFYHIHYDLFRISRRLGFSGGLKKIENYLGISRKNRNLEGIDGKTAIYLWEEYQQTQDKRYLDTLLAYNIEDAVNLKQILYSFYNRLKGLDKLPVKSLDCNSKDLSFPKHPDQEVLALIKEKYYLNKIN